MAIGRRDDAARTRRKILISTQVFAAYAFFGGQMGLTLTAEASHVDVGAYVVIWHILPCCWLLAYVRLFLARAPADGYGAVATLDDEAPGIDPDDRPASRGSIML